MTNREPGGPPFLDGYCYKCKEIIRFPIMGISLNNADVLIAVKNQEIERLKEEIEGLRSSINNKKLKTIEVRIIDINKIKSGDVLWVYITEPERFLVKEVVDGEIWGLFRGRQAGLTKNDFERVFYTKDEAMSYKSQLD